MDAVLCFLNIYYVILYVHNIYIYNCVECFLYYYYAVSHTSPMHTIWWWNVPVLKTAPGVFKNCIMLKWLVFYANCILKVFQSLWNARAMYGCIDAYYTNVYIYISVLQIDGLMHYYYMGCCIHYTYRCAFVSFTKINRILEKRNLIISSHHISCIETEYFCVKCLCG